MVLVLFLNLGAVFVQLHFNMMEFDGTLPVVHRNISNLKTEIQLESHLISYACHINIIMSQNTSSSK